MKRIFLLFILMNIGGCDRDNSQYQLPSDQLTAVQILTSSYSNAKLYNDSLITARNFNPDPARIQYCDSMYHYYDHQFDSCHNLYQHNYTSADHLHNGQGMVQMHNSGGGMMGSGNCQCCTNGGHGAGIHTHMEQLNRLHANYHP